MKFLSKPYSAPRVLIVGAGPTGLMCAINLARMGIKPMIIDKRRSKSSGSKALSLSPLSAQLLDAAGAIKPFLKTCHKTPAFNVHYNGKRLTRMKFSRLNTKHPYFLMQPQPQTEAMMEKRLKSLGVQVHRGFEVVSIHQRSQPGARVFLKSPKGQILQRDFAYVLGCDGAKSAIRKNMGIEFTGHDYSHMHFILADAEIEWEGAKSEAHYFVSDESFMVLAPLSKKLHRIVIKVENTFDPNRKVEFSEIEAWVTKIAPPSFKVKNPVWLSSAPFYNRLASHYRRGCVFLAGDSAHLFSPIGGMGMNTGLGDAYNLSWKVGYVLKGLAPESLLDSYETERRAIAEALVKQTDLSTSLVARLNRHSPQDEAKFLPRFQNREFFRKTLPMSASGLNQEYQSPIGGKLPHYANKIEASEVNESNSRTLDSVELLKNLNHTLLLSEKAQLPEFNLPKFIKTIRISAAAMRELGYPERSFVLVRPDGYVELTSKGTSFDQLKLHLNSQYAVTHYAGGRDVAYSSSYSAFAG